MAKPSTNITIPLSIHLHYIQISSYFYFSFFLLLYQISNNYCICSFYLFYQSRSYQYLLYFLSFKPYLRQRQSQSYSFLVVFLFFFSLSLILSSSQSFFLFTLPPISIQICSMLIPLFNISWRSLYFYQLSFNCSIYSSLELLYQYFSFISTISSCSLEFLYKLFYGSSFLFQSS